MEPLTVNVVEILDHYWGGPIYVYGSPLPSLTQQGPWPPWSLKFLRPRIRDYIFHSDSCHLSLPRRDLKPLHQILNHLFYLSTYHFYICVLQLDWSQYYGYSCRQFLHGCKAHG